MGRVVYTDESGQEHAVSIGPDQPVVTIGRATDCTIRSSRKSVSRNHAELRYDNGVCEVVDLDSSNGTYLIVDGERQPVDSPEPLNHNDEVWCGDFILYYYESDERHRGAAPAGADDLEAYQGEEARTREDVQQPSDLPPEARGPKGGGAQGPSGREAGSGGVEELEPEVIGEVDQETYEQLERLRAEKESIEDLASRQAVEIEELQQRIDELEQQGDGGGESAESERLEEQLREAQSEIAELESELEFERNDNDALTDERDAAEKRARELQREVDRLEDELAEVREDNEALEARVDELQGGRGGGAAGGLGGERMDEAYACVDSLADFVDAFERADLEALSTVDRVRLQGAMREADPKTTLRRLEKLVGSDDDSEHEAE